MRGEVGVEGVRDRVVAELLQGTPLEDGGYHGAAGGVGDQPGLGLPFGAAGRDRVRFLVRGVPVAGLADELRCRAQLLMAVPDLAKQGGDLLIYRVAGLGPERFDCAQVDG